MLEGKQGRMITQGPETPGWPVTVFGGLRLVRALQGNCGEVTGSRELSEGVLIIKSGMLENLNETASLWHYQMMLE